MKLILHMTYIELYRNDLSKMSFDQQV